MPRDDQATRVRLLGYIDGSRSVQRKLGVGIAAATAVALVVFALDAFLGKLALGLVLIVGVCGFWVTAAHISDWRMQLRRLDERGGGRAGRPPPRDTHTTSPG